MARLSQPGCLIKYQYGVNVTRSGKQSPIPVRHTATRSRPIQCASTTPNHHLKLYLAVYTGNGWISDYDENTVAIYAAYQIIYNISRVNYYHWQCLVTFNLEQWYEMWLAIRLSSSTSCIVTEAATSATEIGSTSVQTALCSQHMLNLLIVNAEINVKCIKNQVT